MICGASIAKRDGSHLTCHRSPNHLGDCDPRPPALRVRTGIVVPSRPPDRDYAIVAGAHLLLVLVVLLICCLSGCDLETVAKMDVWYGVGALIAVAAIVGAERLRRRGGK